MFQIVNNANCFLFGSTLFLLVCSAVRVDKYESNSLVNLDSYSRFIVSKESLTGAKIKINEPFNYWHQGEPFEGKIMAVQKKENSKYEVVLSNSQHFPSISWISYRVGTKSIWSEIFK